MNISLEFIVFLFCISSFTCKASGQGFSYDTTDSRLIDLEKKVAESNEKYQHLEDKLIAYAKLNSEVLAELKMQREQSVKKDYIIDSLKKQLIDAQEKSEILTSKLPDNKPDDVRKTGDENIYTGKGMAALNRSSRFVLDQGEAVAFHAVVDANGEIPHHGINQNIIFETVLLNLNGGYHSQHGIFTAPTAGVYMFSTSVLDAGSKPLIHADLVKNGNVLARAYGHGNGGYPEQGSVTVVTQLKAGDEVWVRLSCCADGSITGLRYTSFTGALLMYL